MPENLINIVGSYFQNRSLTSEGKPYEVTCGVPQGCALLCHQTHSGYTDLAILAVNKRKQALKYKINYTIEMME